MFDWKLELSYDSHLEGVQRNNERVNRRFSGDEMPWAQRKRKRKRKKEENQWKEAKRREMRHFVHAPGLS